jgi:SAM-dependent methyltransferase
VADADLGLGCGLPTEHAGLEPGHTVLDLGAGAGIDAFAARHEVGPTGRVLGVDMTPEMVAKARTNARTLGFDNVEFRLGEIEALPVETDTVDVVVSNCVLNLVPDKPRAFAEIARVLRPGGHFCVSDIVTTSDLPEALRRDAALYVGCIAGALRKADYLDVIEAAGFAGVEVAAERVITLPDDVLHAHLSSEEIARFRAEEPHVLSVTVRAAKPDVSG